MAAHPSNVSTYKHSILKAILYVQPSITSLSWLKPPKPPKVLAKPTLILNLKTVDLGKAAIFRIKTQLATKGQLTLLNSNP